MTNGAFAFDGSITMRGMLKSWTITNDLGGTKEVVMAPLRNPHPGDTDLRLCKFFGKFFGLSEGYFLRRQNAYDTLEAKRRIAEQVAKIKPLQAG